MYISIDIGGTKTRVASSKNLKSIFKVKKFASSFDLSTEQANIKSAISEVSDGEEVKYICIGVPGRVDFFNKKILKLPNYSVLDNFPFEFLVTDQYRRTKLLVQNDAVLAGFGEALYGAGCDHKVVAYLTLSTGVGGTRIEKFKDRVSFTASEPGHHIIIQNGRYNPSCGHRGCLEAYVSGKSFEALYGVNPENCTNKSSWEEYAEHLAIGIVNLSAVWAPDVFVLGGSLTKKHDLFEKPLKKHLFNEKFLDLPEIKLSEFKDDSGLLGGFAYISASLKRTL